MRSNKNIKYKCSQRKSNPKVDRRFTQLLPPHKLAGEELNTYIERLRSEGGPTLHVWKEKNILLDNFFEYGLCKKHGIPYRIVYVNLASVAEAKRWIIDIELQRRHLTVYQRCVLVIRHWESYYQSLAKKNQKLSRGRGKKGRKKNVSHFKSIDVSEQLGSKAQVSRDTINKVKRIMKDGTKAEKEKAEAETKSINALCEDIRHRRRHTIPEERPFRTNLKAGVVDNVICRKALDGITLIPDGLITLGFMSPNFNCGRRYPDGVNDDISNEKHLNNLKETFSALLPKFRKGGRCVIEYQQTAPRGKQERSKYYARPVHQQIINMMLEAGYKYADTIIWNKQSVGRNLATHGPYSSPRKPLLRNTHSYLFVFYIDCDTLKCETGEPSELSEEDFERLTKTVWNVTPEYRGHGSNPCPMPIQLAEDAIKVWSFKGDVVLDCYGGSGTTAIAAIRQQRHFIHIDCSQTCCADARERIEKEMKKLNKKNAKKAA